MVKRIVVHYSGWCSIEPEDVKFLAVHDQDAVQRGLHGDGRYYEDEVRGAVITGDKWLKLNEEVKHCNYVLESAGDVIKDSTDGEWTKLNVTEVECE